jgi:hypothetical protein
LLISLESGFVLQSDEEVQRCRGGAEEVQRYRSGGTEEVQMCGLQRYRGADTERLKG